MRGLAGLSILPLLAAGSPLVIDTIHRESAPLISSVDATHVPNSYIVVFKDHVSREAATVHHSWVQDLHLANQAKGELRKRSQFSFQDTVFEGLRHTYDIAGGLMGYSGHFDDEMIEELRRNPDVSVI